MHITLCGCGWLGQPLATALLLQGHTLTATKRSQEGCDQLNIAGISCVPFDIYQPASQQSLSAMFPCDVLVINIPPGRKQMERERFICAMQALIEKAHQGNATNILFISTTAVYGGLTGQITEDVRPQPDTDSAIAHVSIEAYLRQHYPADATILRLAGLVGGKRHPINFLAGKTDLANPHQVVNLVHRDDVIQAITHILTLKIWGETLHLSCTEHPSRQDYYQYTAQSMGLPGPEFQLADKTLTGKWIDASQTLTKLKMQLLYPSPYDFPGVQG